MPKVMTCDLAWFIGDSEHVTLETARTTWVFMHDRHKWKIW